MHRHTVGRALERDDGGGLRPRQEPRDLGQRTAGRVQHDVFALPHLLHSVDAHQQPLHPVLFLGRQGEGRTDEHGMALEDRFHLAQVIRFQRRAARDQIADQIRALEPRGDLDGAGERDDMRRDLALAQEALEQERIRGRDALAPQRVDTLPGRFGRNGERQPAAAEIEPTHRHEPGSAPARGELEALLLEHVEAEETQVADILLHQVRDVVIAHEEYIERHVLPVPDELILAARELETAAHEQIERGVGEAPRLLHGELETRDIHARLSVSRGVRGAPCRFETAGGRGVAAVAAGEKARHPADGRDAHPGEAVDLPVRHGALQGVYHRPAVRHGLNLGRGAQVSQERPYLLRSLERGERDAQVALGEHLLARGHGAMSLHRA